MIVLVSLSILTFSCQSADEQLKKSILSELQTQDGVFAVAFRDLSSGRELLINEKERFHAASTMKTPVMVEIYKQAAEGKFALTDSILIHNEFRSIVDGSPYSLNPADDSEPEIYSMVGKRLPVYDVMYRMIIASSNLATNIMIEKVDARNVTSSLRKMGIRDLEVLRGVEDSKAFRQGLNNTVTAHDLMRLFDKIGKGEAVSPEASEGMIRILLDQKFNDIIPADLPPEVKVAHKTGWIKGLHHDSGIVMLPDGRKYVLVLLSKNLKDEDASVKAMARVSRLIYDDVMKGH